MKNQLIFSLVICLSTSVLSFAGPLENKYPKPKSLSELEEEPRTFLKAQKDREKIQNAMYSENVSADLFRFIAEHRNRMYKLKAKMFSRVNKGIRGKTLYYYRDFKNKRLYLKLEGIDVVNINTVLLKRPFLQRLTGKSIKFKRYFENVEIKQTGVSRNYRYTTRKKTEDFVKGKLERLTIRRPKKYYMKNYNINVYEFDRLPPKINQVIIYNRNQKVNIRNRK